MSDLEYLKATNVVRLQAAARMAGLRWKNGEPGTDKAGIIERLSAHPSIMRATIATLERMAKGENPQAPTSLRSLLDDMLDDEPTRSQSSPEPERSESPSIDAAMLRDYVKQTEFRAALGGIERASVEFARRVNGDIDTLAKGLAALQTQRPVQFTIEGKTYAPVSGQHAMFPRLVKWLALRKIDPVTRKGPRTHALLVGPASSGKTTAALEFAKLMGLELFAQSLSMDSFAVVGYTSPDGKRIETEFTRAWVNGGVFLWDEISMSSPEAVGTLNSALANGFISIPGLGTVYAHPNFYCIAGDNSDTGASLKYGARSLLDGASLDRFVRLEWNIDPTIETALAGDNRAWLAAVRAIRAEIDRRDIAHVGATMRAVITGCMALDAGCFTRAEILADTCKKGAIAEQWGYFESLPAVRAFLQGA